MKLLTRDDFREQVFKRDNHKCVFCDKEAVDAHHIIERRLWPDGGYYLSNGASVCEDHHLECEMTTISVEEVREACGIRKFVLPPHLYTDQQYDKWGNIVLPNGQRLKGELFFDESVQKILDKGGVLSLFTTHIKYSRTYHLPWSPGLHDDDRMMPNTDGFIGKHVVVTEKMDGENTTMYRDHIHARSVDSGNHPSRGWVKNFWSQIRHDIPEGWRVCGENMYAKHSIFYDNLPSYFLGFSIWNERNECLSWEDTLEWFDLLGIIPVPIISHGTYDERLIRKVTENYIGDCTHHEGYVIRIADSFPVSQFRNVVGKYVRKDHIRTVTHWMRGKPITPNQLKNNSPLS